MSDLILLTGATGFVGLSVMNALTENGLGVRVVVRDGKQDDLVNMNNIETIVTTSNLFSENSEWWSKVCDGIDLIIHAAWYSEPGKYLHSEKNIECLMGTLEMAKGAKQVGVRRVVGIGTCFEYDLTEGFLSINTPLKPLTPYAEAKVAAYLELSRYFGLHAIEFAWCRLFYLYGDHEDPRRFVAYLHKKIAAGEPAELTNGNQIRDFLNVRDAGRMIVDVAVGKYQGPVNICSCQAITIREMAENIADQYGRRDLLKFGARSENIIDPAFIVGVRS